MSHYAVIMQDGKVFNRRTKRFEDARVDMWRTCAFDCGKEAWLTAALAEIDTPTAPPAEAPTEAPAPAEESSALQDAKDAAEPKDENGGAKPPHEGNCRECGRWRRLNRLRLCYACFAILVLMEECKKRGIEWKPGDKHPDWCGCAGLGEHQNEDGTAKGFN